MDANRWSRATPALVVLALLILPILLWLFPAGCVSFIHEIAALAQGAVGMLIMFLLTGLDDGLGTALVVLAAIAVLLSFIGVIAMRLWARGSAGRVMLVALLVFNAAAGLVFWPLALGGFPAC